MNTHARGFADGGYVSAPLDLKDILAWVRTKDPRQTYTYTDPEECALAQYLRERGICAQPMVHGRFWHPRYGPGGGDIEPGLAKALHAGSFGQLRAQLEWMLLPPMSWMRRLFTSRR